MPRKGEAIKANPNPLGNDKSSMKGNTRVVAGNPESVTRNVPPPAPSECWIGTAYVGDLDAFHRSLFQLICDGR